MDSGLAALIGSIGGAVVGTLGTLGTTWLSAFLANKKPDPSEEAAKKLLKSLLNGKWQWRDIGVMASVVGTDEQVVRRLLLEIGARGSMRDARLWGLVSRNPIGETDLPKDDPAVLRAASSHGNANN